MESSIIHILRLHPNVKNENGVYTLINRDEPLLEEKIRGILQISGPVTTDILADSLGIDKTFLMHTLNNLVGYGAVHKDRVWSVRLYWLVGTPEPTPELRKHYYMEQLKKSKICNRKAKNETRLENLSETNA